MNILLAQRLLGEFLLDFLYFPIWWYTQGAKRVLLYLVHLFLSANARLAPGLWLKNIFVPMFGQSDFQGRLMSFFMRIVNVIGRSLVVILTGFILIVLFTSWVLFPLFLVYMIIQSSVNL